jgi:putative aldouronate transport system permease protein
MNKNSISNIVFDFFVYASVTVLCIACVLPFIHVIASSFTKPEILMGSGGFNFFPKGFNTRGYELVFMNKQLLSSFQNTLIYVVVGTSISMGVNILAAFALSRKNLLWSRQILLFASFTLLFSGGLIPFYLLVTKNLGWMNTIWALTIPGAVNVWHLIILRTSFKAIPDSLEESAKLDGANDFIVLFRIVLPLSTAVLAVIGLYNVVGYWNSWFYAAIFLNKRDMFPLQLLLREILIQNDTTQMVNTSTMPGVDYTSINRFRPLVKFCITVVATLPIVCVYPFLQRYFIKGIMIGSLKG